jgi:hypothetical protein
MEELKEIILEQVKINKLDKLKKKENLQKNTEKNN